MGGNVGGTLLVTFDFYRHGISCANVLKNPGKPGKIAKAKEAIMDAWKNDATYNACLTSHGARESLRLGKEQVAAHTPYDVVCCSPIARCVQTAYFMFVKPAKQRREIHVMENLRETHASIPENAVDVNDDKGYAFQVNKHKDLTGGADITASLDAKSFDAYRKIAKQDDRGGDLLAFMDETFVANATCNPAIQDALKAAWKHRAKGGKVAEIWVAVATHSGLMKRSLKLKAMPANNMCVRVVRAFQWDKAGINPLSHGVYLDPPYFRGVSLQQRPSRDERYGEFCADKACTASEYPATQKSIEKRCKGKQPATGGASKRKPAPRKRA